MVYEFDSQVMLIRNVFYVIVLIYFLINIMKYRTSQKEIKIKEYETEGKVILNKGKGELVFKGVYLLFVTFIFLIVIQSFDRYDGVTIFTISSFYIFMLVEYIYSLISNIKGKVEINFKEDKIRLTTLKGGVEVDGKDIVAYKIMSGNYGIITGSQLIQIDKGYNGLDKVLGDYLTRKNM